MTPEEKKARKRIRDAKYRERNRDAIRLRYKLWTLYGSNYHAVLKGISNAHP